MLKIIDDDDMQCEDCNKLALRYGQISVMCEDCFNKRNDKKLDFLEEGVINGTLWYCESGNVDFAEKRKTRSQESRT